MGNIKTLPELDRPREKALRYGLSVLSDVELLTILISHGYKGRSALEIASTLLSDHGGLYNLSKIPLSQLKKSKGIKDAKALNLAAIFELHNRLSIKNLEESERVTSSQYLYEKYKDKLLSTHQENLVLIILDRYRKIKHEKTLYVGTENNIIFSYKDIWREMLNFNGKYFYLVHNHPNGKSKPSKEDIIFTSEIFLQSKKLSFPMIDHIIIGEDGYYSFTENKK